MTGTQLEEPPRRMVGNPPARLERLLIGLLAIYLIPVLLVVLSIGLVGIVCGAMIRWVGGGPSRAVAQQRGRRWHGAHQAIRAPRRLGVLCRSTKR